MQITQKIKLNIYQLSDYCYVDAKQADDNSRFLNVQFTDGDNDIFVTAGVTVTLRCQKPDGTAVYNNGTRESDGTVTVELTDQVLAVPGVVYADISTSRNGEILSSATFVIRVIPVPTGTQIVSTNEFLQLTELIEELEQLDVVQLQQDIDGVIDSIAEEYSSVKTYNVGDYAWYDGYLYRCTTTIATAETWTAGHWAMAQLAKESTDAKRAIPYTRLKYFQFRHGGLAINGDITSATNRIRTEIIHVKAGTTISCEEGYKFNICVYNNYLVQSESSIAQPNADALIYCVPMRTEPYALLQDGYVALSLGRVDDADLWSIVDEHVVFNQLTEQCANSVYIDIPDYDGNSHSYSKDYRLRQTALTPHTDYEPTPSGPFVKENLCVYYTLSPYGYPNEGAKVFKMSCSGYYIKAYMYKGYSEGGYYHREIIAYNDYQLDANTIYIDAPKEDGYDYSLIFVIKSSLAEHRTPLTENQIGEITENTKLYLGSMIDATLSVEGDYADAKAVGDILFTPVTIEKLGFTFGGLYSSGQANNKDTRIRYISNATYKGAFWASAGTEITAEAGYKFNVGLYSEYENNSNYVLIDFRNMGIGSYTVPEDCYIRISIGTTNDDVLWTMDADGNKTYTSAGIAAQSAITISGLEPIPLNERVDALENSNVLVTPWESAKELKTEIPLNALEFHALFNDLVDSGKITRTLLGNIGNDPRYPVYLYTLRNDMDHKAQDYSRVPWDGSNELYQRPKIWLDAGIHGNERTMPLAMYSFIDKLVNNIYYQDMLNAFDWYFVPLVNPWGFSHTAYNNVTEQWTSGASYTEETKADYTVYENTAEHHAGIRQNEAGIDANRDFTAFRTQEASIIRDAFVSLTADNRNFVFAIDSHQATGGTTSEVNALGAFLSLHYGADQTDKDFIYNKWMQAGAKTESIMADYCGVNNVQSIFPWDGTSLRTMRNFMHDYADYAMCFEGGQTCVYYSGSATWSNEIARTFCNTQYHQFLQKLTGHWM